MDYILLFELCVVVSQLLFLLLGKTGGKGKGKGRNQRQREVMKTEKRDDVLNI